MIGHRFNAAEIKLFRENLLAHYDKSKRDLPWRKIVRITFTLSPGEF